METGGEARILHFATHAYLDDRFPLNSALVLSARRRVSPGARMVYSRSGRFSRGFTAADLVSPLARQDGASARSRAAKAGQPHRAFQAAGARTVLASLWNVNDQATSELMIRFYKHLLSGMPKDQALQAAQRELIAGPIEVINEKGEREVHDWSAPYYWAGFQLYGDWQ